MIVPNASIRGYSTKTGDDAQGAATFQELTLPEGIYPAVRVDDPESIRRTTPEAEGIENERRISVMRSELAAIGVAEPKAGDLVTLKFSHSGSDARFVINSLKLSGTPDLAGSPEIWRMACSPA